MKNIDELRFELNEDKEEFVDMMKAGLLLETHKSPDRITYIFDNCGYYEVFVFDDNGFSLGRNCVESLVPYN